MKKSFKQTCIELRKKDFTLDEIVEKTGRPKTSVYFHIKKIPLSTQKRKSISEETRRRALLNSSKRKGVSLRPFRRFSSWTPDMVLLISHLMFDGELNNGKCRYHNRSHFLISRVENLMKIIYTYPPKKYTDKKSGVVSLGFYNVALENYLHKRSEDLVSSIKNETLNNKREFIRAFFDDEGCMDVRRNKRRIRGYQKDKNTLSLVQTLLQDFGVEAYIQMPNEVVISGKENLIKFRDQINFSKGVRINPNRTNSLWKKNLEKRKLLDIAIASYKK